jgi:hypothetical protein
MKSFLSTIHICVGWAPSVGITKTFLSLYISLCFRSTSRQHEEFDRRSPRDHLVLIPVPGAGHRSVSADDASGEGLEGLHSAGGRARMVPSWTVQIDAVRKYESG